MDIDPDSSEIADISPERLMRESLESARIYGDCARALARLDAEFEYDALDDAPEEALIEADKHAQYMNRITAFYLGDDPETAIENMSFPRLLMLSRKIGREVDWHTYLGEAITFKDTIWNFFDDARKKTVIRLQDKVLLPIDESEEVGASEALVGDDLDFKQDPNALKLAIERFGRATKVTLPGVGDFRKLRDLISSSGAVALSLGARYMDRNIRLSTCKKIFEGMNNPDNMREIYSSESGDWALYLQLKHAPQTVVEQVRLHQEAFQEIDRAEVTVEAIPAKARSALLLLKEVTNSGLRQNIMGTLEGMSMVVSDSPSRRDNRTVKTAARNIRSSLKLVEDQEFRDEVERRLEMMLAA